MKILRLLATAIALATAFLAASCSKTSASAPEAFTAQLENIDGVRMLYSLQHPKLIAQCLDKLIAEVPEASYGRILLENYGKQFGYPEFTEIAAGSNIGILQLMLPIKEYKQRPSMPIFFIKLKENGKIWNALVNQFGMSVRKHGEWAMFAQSATAIDSVPDPDAIIARLSAPQAENLRVFVSFYGEAAAAYKDFNNDMISTLIGRSTLPDAEKIAFAAYARILFGEIFDSLHSGYASLNLGDTGVSLVYGAQFKPDTPIGTFLRYRSDATPDIGLGRYLANDAILTTSYRYTPKAAKDLADHLINRIIKVDYPPFSEPLAKFHKDGAIYWEQDGGCGAMTNNMKIDMTNLQAPQTTSDTFSAHSGKFDQQSRQYIQSTIELVQKLATHMLTIVSQASAKKVPQISITSATDALTLEGISFDAMTMNITAATKDITIPPQTTYFGIANGNLVTSSNEATLKKRLPALLAKKVQPDNVAAANPLQPYDLVSMSTNGSALADMVFDTAKIDMTDTDAQATLASIKELYKQSGPIRGTVEARQAALTFKADIPYKFISASVKLGRYVYSVKNTAGQ